MKKINKFNEAYRSVIKEQRYTPEDNPFMKACEYLESLGFLKMMKDKDDRLGWEGKYRKSVDYLFDVEIVLKRIY